LKATKRLPTFLTPVKAFLLAHVHGLMAFPLRHRIRHVGHILVGHLAALGHARLRLDNGGLQLIEVDRFGLHKAFAELGLFQCRKT
jgi:hypothetical protein